MSDDYQRNDADPFLVNVVEYEGYPLALRVRPNADTAENRLAYSRLLMLTHELAQVLPNGLPESGYNQSLAGFDQDVFQFFESEGDGIVAFVETFSGKRNYYAYVDVGATFRARAAELEAKYPQHKIRMSHRIETGWEMYQLYRKLYPW